MPLLCPFLNKPCIESKCNLWAVFRIPANNDPEYGPIIKEDLDLSKCAFLVAAAHAQAEAALKISRDTNARLKIEP